MRRAFLLLALLAVPVAASEGDHLTARSATWTGGEVRDSEFAALFDSSQSIAWRMTATNLHVLTVIADAYTKAPGVLYSAPKWETKEGDYSQTFLEGHEARPEGFVYVWPSPGQAPPRIAFGCGADAQPAGESAPSQPADQIRQPNPNPTFPIDQSLVLRPCSTLTVCGAFTMTLWERDARGDSAQGKLDLRSGQLERPGEPDLRPALGRAEQLYLSTTDGCLELTPTDTTALLMQQLGLGNVAGLVLQGAQGSLGAIPLRDSELRLSNVQSLALARSDAGLTVQDVHGIQAVSVNGASIPLTSAAHPVSDGTGWLGLGLLGMVGAVLSAAPLVVRLRRRRFEENLSRHIDAAHDLHNRMRDHKALAKTQRLVAHDPINAEVCYLHGRSLLNNARPVEALRFLERGVELARREKRDAPFCAEVCIEAAKAAAIACKADPSDARRAVVKEYLRQALVHEPGCLRALSLQEPLVPFVREFVSLPVNEDFWPPRP